MARRKGIVRIIVAGGETSGEVARVIGHNAYYIGDSVAPGIPVLIPTTDLSVRLIFKSGNFGEDNFFEKALLST